MIIAYTIFYFTGKDFFRISVKRKCNKGTFKPRSLNFNKDCMKPEDLLECKFPLKLFFFYFRNVQFEYLV